MKKENKIFKTFLSTSLVMAILITLGCAGGLNFSKTYPMEEGFHPKSIVLLPVTVGDFESARSCIDGLIVSELQKTTYFEEVVESENIASQLMEDNDLQSSVESFLNKLNGLGICEEDLAKNIGERFKADAILVVKVTDWSYGRLEGDKIATVGLSFKFINPSAGKIRWVATHEITEDYTFMKPSLSDLAKDLIDKILKQMPV